MWFYGLSEFRATPDNQIRLTDRHPKAPTEIKELG